MTTHEPTATGPDWAPESCTLPTGEQPLRMAEFDRLLTTTAHHARPSPLELVMDLDPNPDTAARVAALAVRESACCAFFTFTLTATSDRLRLSMAVPANQSAVLDAITARAGTTRDSRS